MSLHALVGVSQIRFIQFVNCNVIKIRFVFTISPELSYNILDLVAQEFVYIKAFHIQQGI